MSLVTNTSMGASSSSSSSSHPLPGRRQHHPSTPSAPSTASAQVITAHADPPHPRPRLQPTLPSAETQRHVAQARAAVVASMGNLLDAELQSRAQMLHDNAAALERQERDVARATEALHRETGKLAGEADQAARKLKEVGNVQNWAEVLERGFLVLEETVRLAKEEDESSGCSCSDCEEEEPEPEPEPSTTTRRELRG